MSETMFIETLRSETLQKQEYFGGSISGEPVIRLRWVRGVLCTLTCVGVYPNSCDALTQTDSNHCQKSASAGVNYCRSHSLRIPISPHHVCVFGGVAQHGENAQQRDPQM